MIRRPPRSTLSSSSAASDVYKRQLWEAGDHKTAVGIIVHDILALNPTCTERRLRQYIEFDRRGRLSAWLFGHTGITRLPESFTVVHPTGGVEFWGVRMTGKVDVPAHVVRQLPRIRVA
eukprot:TRINITY_DN4269_c0_g2_i5.p1 TRINITY_DN4269_c0_g2~~TRINITY_DN4269_c0_g2_i5.p1  ORF type:complete len:119 (+),score=18.22 TRINITY_DN4269_c0_g2_i5:140-496(+)